RPGIQEHRPLELWIPGFLATLGPRNDQGGSAAASRAGGDAAAQGKAVRAALALALQGFGDLEGELDGLAGVEARVTMRQVVGGAHARAQREAAGLVRRVELANQPQHLVGFGGRAAFHADRVLDAAQEFDMRAVELLRAVAEPDKMRRAVVPVAGC